MIELPLSVVAWISVVLIQAIAHYVVLGSRRGQLEEGADFTLEESLSLATEATDDADNSFTVKDCGYQGPIIPSTGKPSVLGSEDIDCSEPVEFLELLDQTGTELFKVGSVEHLVEEQVRAVS